MRTDAPLPGRHEFGQNFLHHAPTVRLMVELCSSTRGAILEIGPGDGALTRPLLKLGRPITAIELDPRQAATLRAALPTVTVIRADALRVPLDFPVIVGNLPFHLTTPLLRHFLESGQWQRAVVLTQWEVARKRAHVGGGTMMTAQHAPWFEFHLEARVPRAGFRPIPSVDGGVLRIDRRSRPLVPEAQRRRYQRFVRAVFTGRGRDMARALRPVAGGSSTAARRLLGDAGVSGAARPRDVTPEQWSLLWRALQRVRG